MRQRRARRTLGGLTAAAALLAVAACSGGTPSATPSTSPTAEPITRYVAIGDSYTAAPGVPDTAADDPCQRSSNSYPQLVEQELRPAAFAEAACSGAQTKDIAGSQATGLNSSQPPQLDAVTADTDLVTIGMGGNDFDIFTTVVGRCSFVTVDDPTGSPCRRALRTADGEDGLLSRLPTVEQRVVAAVGAVRAKAPQARILLVGYPQIIPASGTCDDLLPLADGDYTYAREVNQGLDQVLRGAAASTGTTYVDVWGATAGHDICADDPWINGRETTDEAAAYHPFAAEQEEVARLVVAAVRG